LPLFALTAYAGMRILPSLYRIAHFSNEILLGRSAVIQLTTDVDAPASASDEQLTSSIRNGITVENVSFTYPEARRATLERVSLHIERGVRLGIVGASGTGKSTLLHLVAGLLEPSEGSIAFDGAPLRDVPRKIAIVPQTVVLYDASLRENVAFGIEPAAIDEEQLRRVLTIAQLNEVVAVLPDGLDTMVGERGARLSVGERQRVGVARALYADPEVLLLDEPTSALDAETEKRLIHALGTSLRGVTLLLVTHSPAALKLCDCSILVDDGAVTVTIAEHAAL
jgi:ABC-type multidrug transport system fused ATPase/permease subunit